MFSIYFCRAWAPIEENAESLPATHLETYLGCGWDLKIQKQQQLQSLQSQSEPQEQGLEDEARTQRDLSPFQRSGNESQSSKSPLPSTHVKCLLSCSDERSRTRPSPCWQMQELLNSILLGCLRRCQMASHSYDANWGNLMLIWLTRPKKLLCLQRDGRRVRLWGSVTVWKEQLYCSTFKIKK